ncbi:hypothetical protein, partial [uncultured Rothia sp.]|uniref:hypothetical protein n=1 Tax=uncultured Rothia sp. TaxID=316088 RepID=UPI003217A7FE
MTELHYKLTEETKINAYGVKLHRIEATKDLPRFVVSAGDKGGWVEDTKNLGDAWVYGNAEVSGDAWVSGDAR